MSRSNSWGGDVLAVAIVCFLLMFVGGIAAVGTLYWWGPTKEERNRARESYDNYRYGYKDKDKDGYYGDYKYGATEQGYDDGYDDVMKTEPYPYSEDESPNGYDGDFGSKDGYKDY